MEVDIEIHALDDYEAIYINGKLTGQNNDGTLSDYLSSVGKLPLTIKTYSIQYHIDDNIQEYCYQNGSMPKTVKELNEVMKG